MDQEQAELSRHSPMDSSGDGSSEEIRHQIARRRADMDLAANALARRLDPHQLADEVATAVKRKLASRGERIRTAVFESVKSHPLPWILIGGGVGWLVVRSRQGSETSDETALQPRSDYDWAGSSFGASHGTGVAGSLYPEPGETATGVTSRAREKVSDAAGTAKEKLTDATDAARDKLAGAKEATREKVHSAAAKTREKASETREKMSAALDRASDRAGEVREQLMSKAVHAYGERPLLLAGAVLGIGVLAGMAIPTTPLEDRLMGETRDRLLDSARTKGQELLDRGKEMAGKVSQVAGAVASNTSQELSHLRGGDLGQQASQAARTAVGSGPERR